MIMGMPGRYDDVLKLLSIALGSILFVASGGFENVLA
jgi:hypothetical protein